jgi:hypothetical protein
MIGSKPVVVAMLGAAALASAVLTAQSRVSETQKAIGAVKKDYAPPKTPWGDPDLQGKWPGIDLVGVPMVRPANLKLGTSNTLTEDQFKARQAQFERQAAQDEADFDPDQAEALEAKFGTVGGARVDATAGGRGAGAQRGACRRAQAVAPRSG